MEGLVCRCVWAPPGRRWTNGPRGGITQRTAGPPRDRQASAGIRLTIRQRTCWMSGRRQRRRRSSPKRRAIVEADAQDEI
jgi:hypothetical protein